MPLRGEFGQNVAALGWRTCALWGVGGIALTRRLFCVHPQGGPRYDAGTDEGRGRL